MAVVYSIRNWDRHFEVSQTKKVKGPLTWVAIPTKHDGKGFRRIMREPDGASIYGAWTLLLQVAAKCPERGVLADEDGPLTAFDLELKTGMPAEVFEKAFQVLSSQQVRWLVKHEDSTAVERSGTDSTVLPLHNRTGHNNTKDSSIEESCSQQTQTFAGEPTNSAADTERLPDGEHEAQIEGVIPPPSGKQDAASDRERCSDGEQDVFLHFPTAGRTKVFVLKRAKVAEYQESFPGVDVPLELRKARQWCVDNPKKRKTERGMLSFLTRWLGNAQDRVRGSPSAPVRRSRVPTEDDLRNYNPTAEFGQ